MSIADVATAVVSIFPAGETVQTPGGPVPLQVLMVAISGAENHWSTSPGDPLSAYPDGGASEQAWSCEGYTSFGSFQVNLPANHGYVTRLSGLSDPCDMAQWLADYTNAAQVAWLIYQSQGPWAWTTFKTGAYTQYLDQAAQAVAVASGASPPAPPGQSSPSSPPSSPVPGRVGLSVGQKVAVGAGVALLIGGGLGLVWWLLASPQREFPSESPNERGGTALRPRGPVVGSPPPRGAFFDVDTRVPEEIARAYLEDLPAEEVRQLLGATPDTERAFTNLLRFQAARHVPTRLEEFPPILEDGRVVGTILGAYLPQPGNEVVWLGPQVLSEDPRALDTEIEEVAHSLLHSPACDIYGETMLAYQEMPQEVEAKTAGMLARLRTGIPFETDTGRRIDPATVRARVDRIEADMGALTRQRVEWAADVTARAIRGDIAGAAAASSVCPKTTRIA